jgi:hypothetical protein
MDESTKRRPGELILAKGQIVGSTRYIWFNVELIAMVDEQSLEVTVAGYRLKVTKKIMKTLLKEWCNCYE